MFYLHDFLLDIIFETHSKTKAALMRNPSTVPKRTKKAAYRFTRAIIHGAREQVTPLQ